MQTKQYKIQNNTKYKTIQYNTIQYNTIQYNTIQYNTIQYNTIQYKQHKVRLQIQTTSGAERQYNGMIDALVKIVKNEGATGLWKGLTPALLRQSSYSSIRMVCFSLV